MPPHRLKCPGEKLGPRYRKRHNGGMSHLDPGRRRASARERLRRYQSGAWRVDLYLDVPAAEVIAALSSPHVSTSALINKLIVQSAASRADVVPAACPDPSPAET